MTSILRGFLPANAREFRHQAGSRNLKVWFRSWHEHYEVQAISPGARMEIGFHAEHPRADENDRTLTLLSSSERRWRRALGKDPVAGPFLGRKEHRQRWRRVSEVWEGARADDEPTLVEAVERLSVYIRSLEPLLDRPVETTCACWRDVRAEVGRG